MSVTSLLTEPTGTTPCWPGPVELDISRKKGERGRMEKGEDHWMVTSLADGVTVSWGTSGGPVSVE